MSGPPYPHPNPVPGSNGIGFFTIGVSQVGDIPAFDYWRTVISQYGNSTILTQLISNMFQYLDPTVNLDNFFDFIWNVDSAQGYGLDVWGRIVGVIRTVNLPSAGRYFGFEEQSITVDPFNQSPFYNGGALTTSFQLADDAFRVLIFAKALANISDGSVKSINQLLLNLFPGRGNCFVTDGAPDGFTKLLIHGTPVGSVPVDASPVGNQVTLNGGAGITAAINPFGGPGSIFFPPSSSLVVPNSSNFLPTGDYTLDGWVFSPSIGGTTILFTTGGFSPYLLFATGGSWQFFASSTGTSWDIASGVVVGSQVSNTWQHIAVSRSGNTYRTFLNGVPGGTATSSAVPFRTSLPVSIGNNSGGSGAFLSDVRFSLKALWTGAFTPPVSPVSSAINMTLSYVFTFALTSTEVAIITQSGILPKSTGCSLTIVQQVA